MSSLDPAVSLRDLGLDVRAERSATQPKAWGVWATLAWITAIYLVVIASHKLFPLPWDELQRWSKQGTFGFFISQLGYGAIHLLMVAALFLAARLAGWSVSEYFALSRPRLRDILMYSCVPLGLLFAQLPYFVSTMHAWANPRPGALLLLWAGVFPIVFAPLWEELVFRGFVFRGLAQSRLGTVGAIVVSSLCFAGMHPLFNGSAPVWFLVYVFLVGLYLGWVRHRTGSTPLTILFHAIINLPHKLVGSAIILGWIR